MTTIDVLAPCPGRLLPIEKTPDPVFAGEMLGPGVAIDPEPRPTTVVAPVAGTLVAIHPHAFVVLTTDGVGVLTHLGINTVRLEGAPFEVLAAKGDVVEAGTPVVRWDPSTVSGEDISTVVPVVVMDRKPGTVVVAEADAVAVGDVVFSLPPLV